MKGALSFNTNMMSPPSSLAPLHDIIGPVSFFPYTPGQLAIALSIALLFLGGLVWGIWKWRQQPPLTSQQKTLRALALMKKDLMIGSDHDFGISISTLLRAYLGEVFGMAAPRQTTEEFLTSLQDHKKFTSLEQVALRDFLKQSDVLKFAQGVLQQEERLALILAAEELVQRSEVKEKASEKKNQKRGEDR